MLAKVPKRNYNTTHKQGHRATARTKGFTMSYNRYEAKANYVRAMNAKNAEVETLTAEQHEMIQAICTFRHEVHSNIDTYFNACVKHSAEVITDDFSSELFSDDFLFELNVELERLNLPKFSTSFDFISCPDDSWVEADRDDEEEWQDEYDGLYNECYQEFNKLNADIEKWLLNIDNTHGTSYCPTGFARLK